MSLTPHANSVVTDKELACTAHHVTLAIDRYDNIVHKRFVSCDVDRSQQNVGQMIDDSCFFLDTKTSNMVSKHESHTHISESNMDFSVEHFEQILVTSRSNLAETFQDEISSLRTVMSGLKSDLNNQRSSMDRVLSDLKTGMSNLKTGLINRMAIFGSNIQSELSSLKFEFTDGFKAVRGDLA